MQFYPYLREALKDDATFKAAVEDIRETERCAEYLANIIDSSYANNRLDVRNVIDSALEHYEPERIALVLAVRVYDNDGFDGRISRKSEDWAKSILANIPEDYKDKSGDSPIKRTNMSFLPQTHQGLINMVIENYARSFPDIELVRGEATAALATGSISVLSMEDTPSTNDSVSSMKCIHAKMQYPTSGDAYRLMSRVRLEEPTALYMQHATETCELTAYESGQLRLTLNGMDIPLTGDEYRDFCDVLENYMQNEYGKTLASIWEERPQNAIYALHFPEENFSAEDLQGLKEELEAVYSEDGVQWNADNTAVCFPDVIPQDCEEIEETLSRYHVAFERFDNDAYEKAMETEAAEASRFIADYDEEFERYFIFERNADNQSFSRYQDKSGNFPAFNNKEDAIKYAASLENENGKEKKREEPER